MSKDLELKVLEQKIRDVTFSSLCALVQLLDLKDMNTGVHSSRLVEWAMTLSKLADVSGDELRDIEIAAALHDIGKIGIPDEILKKPSDLTPEEQTVMRRHPEYGWAVMKNIPGCQSASLLILHHHEMWNGRGYPAGLSGEGIPRGARIVAIADAFDAVTTDRPYRKGLPILEAMSRLEHFAGAQFDPALLAIFSAHIRSETAQASR